MADIVIYKQKIVKSYTIISKYSFTKAARRREHSTMKIHHACTKKLVLFCFPLFFMTALLPLAAQQGGQVLPPDIQWPYTLGGGAEININTRAGAAMGYGASVDRIFAYHGDTGIFLVGAKGSMETDFNGISGTEADIYIRLNLFRLGPGSFFTQLTWGYATYREVDMAPQTMLADITVGYRVFFLKGFYVEPYFRAGFPFLIGGGLMAGHRFSF